MSLKRSLIFGPIAAIILCLGISGLGAFVPGYSQVRQTVSEIGEVGSAMRFPLAVALCATAVCLFVFAWGVGNASTEAGHSRISACFVAWMGLCAAGVGIFAYPHPLHNVFGLGETIGFQAPAVLAFTWRGDLRSRVAPFSGILYALLLLAIAANLSVLDRHSALWTYERSVYGLVQRSLFLVWSVWCAGTGILLLQPSRPAARPGPTADRVN